MRFIFAFVLALTALPALAQERPVLPEEFESLVTGSTLLYRNSQREHGAEEYLDNRRVRWSFLDGDCTEGYWYPKGPQICFVYDDYPNEQCWQFYQDGGRLIARFEDSPTGTELYETSRRDSPLYCLGPEIGV